MGGNLRYTIGLNSENPKKATVFTKAEFPLLFLTTYEQYFIDRLQSVFNGVATNPLVLRNSKNVPLYLLCFAAGNQKGAPIAVKIAQEILEGMQNPPQLTFLD